MPWAWLFAGNLYIRGRANEDSQTLRASKWPATWISLVMIPETAKVSQHWRMLLHCCSSLPFRSKRPSSNQRKVLRIHAWQVLVHRLVLRHMLLMSVLDYFHLAQTAWWIWLHICQAPMQCKLHLHPHIHSVIRRIIQSFCTHDLDGLLCDSVSLAIPFGKSFAQCRVLSSLIWDPFVSLTTLSCHTPRSANLPFRAPSERKQKVLWTIFQHSHSKPHRYLAHSSHQAHILENMCTCTHPAHQALDPCMPRFSCVCMEWMHQHADHGIDIWAGYDSPGRVQMLDSEGSLVETSEVGDGQVQR